MRKGILLLCIVWIGLYAGIENDIVQKNKNQWIDNKKISKLNNYFKTYKKFENEVYSINKKATEQNLWITNQIIEDVLLPLSKLQELKTDTKLHFANSRGIKEINLFKSISPAVVLILTKKGIGSGVIIKPNGIIVTNSHVVGNNKKVLVALKPKSGSSPKVKDLLVAKVLKVNQISDLALIKLVKKTKNIHIIHLGKKNSYQIGQDVHAIGHPEGNLWTYTKGYISQIRDNYEWQSFGGLKHYAKVVIQTQTPINPGNSGGPLFDDKGNLLGINSFKKSGGEGLNYAVSVDDVILFLQQKGNIFAEQIETPEKKLSKKLKINVLKIAKVDYFKKGQKNDVMIIMDSNFNNVADVIAIDIGSTGFFEIFIYDKDENGKPELITYDTNKNNKPDIYLFDSKKSGKFDVKGYDYNEDGEIDKFERI